MPPIHHDRVKAPLSVSRNFDSGVRRIADTIRYNKCGAGHRFGGTSRRS